MKKIILLFALAGIMFACTNPAGNSMSKKTDENKALLKKFYNEVFNVHDVSKIDSFITPGFVDHNPDPGHSGKGPDDVKAMFTEMISSIPDVHVSIDFMVAEGDTVVSYVTMSGTNTGPMGNMPATNKSFKINGIDIVVIKDGKATERWGVFDNLSMMMQMAGRNRKLKGHVIDE